MSLRGAKRRNLGRVHPPGGGAATRHGQRIAALQVPVVREAAAATTPQPPATAPEAQPAATDLSDDAIQRMLQAAYT